MIERFVTRRRGRWERFSSLLGRVNAVRGRISVDELDEFARLYRQISADLATVQRDFPSDNVANYLNQVLSRAHALVYREPPAPLSRLRRFFAHDLPVEYRRAWPYLATAAALFFVPLLAVAIAVILSKEAARLVLPEQVLAAIKQGHTWFDIELAEASFVSSLIMTHNIQVSAFALAGGMLAGLGTVYVLLSNGVFIGAVFGALIAYGLADRLVGFVSPHGFLELSTVIIAGACGLMLGRAIVWSGLESRGAALVAAAVRSIRLLLGSVVFLVIAGLLEGFVSPARFAWQLKLAIGLGTAVLMYGYLLLLGRSPGRTSSAWAQGARRADSVDAGAR